MIKWQIQLRSAITTLAPFEGASSNPPLCGWYLIFKQLDKVAYRISDNEFVDQMNLAKKRLFKHINEQKLATF